MSKTAPIRPPWQSRPLAVIFLLTVFVTTAFAGESRLGDMPFVRIDVDGETFTVRLAATRAHRAAGFQHAAPTEMDDEAIYFAYERAFHPAFHMRNVARPLLLAWIAPDGRVRRVIRMAPETTGHRPAGTVSAVLEYTQDHPLADRVRTGSVISPAATSPEDSAAGGG